MKKFVSYYDGNKVYGMETMIQHDKTLVNLVFSNIESNQSTIDEIYDQVVILYLCNQIKVLSQLNGEFFNNKKDSRKSEYELVKVELLKNMLFCQDNDSIVSNLFFYKKDTLSSDRFEIIKLIQKYKTSKYEKMVSFCSVRDRFKVYFTLPDTLNRYNNRISKKKRNQEKKGKH